MAVRLGAICYFTGAVTAANAALLQYDWPRLQLRPAVGRPQSRFMHAR